MIRSLAAALLISGCAYARSASVPMPATAYPSASEPRGVVVFLPGLGDSPETFEENGFVDLVNELGYDAVLADAHFGYYRERTLGQRLEADVLARLRVQGYRELWLVGISLGGFGSIRYAVAHTAQVTGVIVLAPFLGEVETWAPIDAAGGLAKWEPADPAAVLDVDERVMLSVWTWLKRYERAGVQPELYLGYGAADRFAPSCGLVAAVLPVERVEVAAGGHDWATWTPIFQALAERALKE